MSNNDERDIEMDECPFCHQQIAQRTQPQRQPERPMDPPEPLGPFSPFMPFGPQTRPQTGPQTGPPSGPPFGTPPGQQRPQGQQGPPSGPPPSGEPRQPQRRGAPGTRAVEPGAIRPCTFRYVFIWPERGRGYWAWLVFVGRRSAAGWRWNGRRWVYFGVDLDTIESFVCY